MLQIKSEINVYVNFYGIDVFKNLSYGLKMSD